MAYPFGPNPTFNELLRKLTEHKVSLCLLTKVEYADGGGQPWYLHRPGSAPFGIEIPASGDSPMTWQWLRAICSHFDIGAEEFGLTAGWPSYG